MAYQIGFGGEVIRTQPRKRRRVEGGRPRGRGAARRSRTPEGGTGWSRRGLSEATSCVHETMNSECESHYPRAGRKPGAAEGNCAAATRGGEQPEAEGWSETKVNSIRQAQRASQRGKSEACRASGESVTVRELPKLDTGRCECGWSRNDRKGAWSKWRSRSGRLSRDGVRGSIGAEKPGNAGGAKGPRKVNA